MVDTAVFNTGVKKQHTTPRGYRLGWKPGLPNKLHHRKFSAVHTKQVTLPPKVDLSAKLPYIFDQKDTSSCTANAACYIYGALHGVSKIEDAFSRLFYYYNERLYENDVNEDGGAAISDGVTCLAAKGVCKEKTWPFDEKQLYTKPSDAAYHEALGFKIRTKSYLENRDEYRQALAQNFLWMIGISCFSNLDSDFTARTGLLTMPGHEDQMTGGHAICCVGYDTDFHNSEMFKASGATPDQYKWDDVYIFANSWGDSFGYKGFMAIPAEYIDNTDISSDGWTFT